MDNEKIKRIRAIYDGFEKKDLPWSEFLKEYLTLTSPFNMRRDLKEIVSREQLGRSTKAKIDEVVSNHNRGVLCG